MKKGLIALAVCFSTAQLEAKEIVISEVCEEFHQRSYCIYRLTKAVDLIKKTHENKACQKIGKEKFCNQRIVNCIREMEEKDSLKPFFYLWRDLKAYKYLDDETLTPEFTKMVFALQHALYEEHGHFPKKNVPSFDMKTSLDGRSFTEATTIRSYYAHRLKEPLQLLKKVNCSQRSFFEVNEEGCNCAFISHHIFKCSAIKSCVKHMEDMQSVKELLSLGRDFANFKLIQDDLFTREFIYIVFLAMRNLFINNVHITKNLRTTASLIAQTYNNLEKLPLEEILEAIDLLQKELPPLLEKYEFNSKMKWKKWLKKYWWVPPTTGSVIMLRILWVFFRDTPPPNNPLL